MYSTVLYYTVQHCIYVLHLLYCTALYCTTLYCTVLQGTAVFDQPAGDEGQLYHYQSQTEHGMGPPVPELEELGSYGCVHVHVCGCFCVCSCKSCSVVHSPSCLTPAMCLMSGQFLLHCRAVATATATPATEPSRRPFPDSTTSPPSLLHPPPHIH